MMDAPDLHGDFCRNRPFGGPIPAEPLDLAILPDRHGAIAKKAMADTALTWQPGKELLIYFLNGSNAWGQVIRSAIQRIAVQWSSYANIKFRFVTSGPAHVTVNLQTVAGVGYGMYSCYLGTDCLEAIKAKTPAMHLVFNPNIQANPAFMEQEFQRVILHEFGHALGFVHEHMRPDAPVVWDVAALDRFCATYYGWDAATVRDQILDRYDPRKPGSTIASAFDPNSIMMYQYPTGVATYKDGSPFATPNNVALTAMDKVVAAMAYPLGADSMTEGQIVPGAPPVPGSISYPGQVARYRFIASQAGDHVVQVTGPKSMLLAVMNKRRDPAGRMLAAQGSPASIAFHPEIVGREYYVEVRCDKPTMNVGVFTIGVRPPSGMMTEQPTPSPSPASQDPIAVDWDDAGA